MPQGTTTGSGYRETLDGMLDEHRAALHDCLGGLGEEEVRRSLVPSRTTLLGLVKHVTFVERVWFDQAVTGRSRRQIGIPATPDASFVLRADDTVATVQAAYREVCEASRRTAAGLELDAVVTERGEHPVWRIYLHMVRELAQHCGHADILREQILAARG
jgi:hypothetical protein